MCFLKKGFYNLILFVRSFFIYGVLFFTPSLYGQSQNWADRNFYSSDWSSTVAEDGDVNLEIPIGHADILSIAYGYKKYLQESLDKAVKCSESRSKLNPDMSESDEPYLCAEYPFGHIIGNQKFFMLKEGGNWKHVTIPFKDKSGRRELEIPIELEREFRNFTVPPSAHFSLLNSDTPGAAARAFPLTRKSLGETLVKFSPQKDRLYVHTCQFFNGSYIKNKNFSGKYTYAKVWRKKLSAGFKGKLGGIDFDALKVCLLLKVNVDRNNKLVTTTLDVEVPTTYNLKREPLEIKLTKASWVGLLLFAIIITAILVLLPGLIAAVMAWVLGAISALILGVGIIGSFTNIPSKIANDLIDKKIRETYNLSIEDLNNKTWAQKVNYEEIPFFDLDKNPITKGDFKDGSWALSVLTKGLLKDQMLLGLASAQVSYDESFQQMTVGLDELKTNCLQTVKELKDEQINAPEEQDIYYTQLIKDLNFVCTNVNTRTIETEYFKGILTAQKNGCYDSYVRFDDLHGKRIKLLNYLKQRVDEGSGENNEEIKEAIQERIDEEMETVELTNWWAEKDSEAYCGFKNFINIAIDNPNTTTKNSQGDTINSSNLLVERLYRILLDYQNDPDKKAPSTLLSEGNMEIANIVNIEALDQRLKTTHPDPEKREEHLNNVVKSLNQQRNTDSKTTIGTADIIEALIMRLKKNYSEREL